MAFVNVEGTVSRLHNSGNGFGLKESWQSRDGERSRYWAVFPKDPVQVSEGDRVKVSGGLQTKVTEPRQDSKVYVDHTVGGAKIEVVSAQSQNGAGGPQNSRGSQVPTGGGNSPQNTDAASFGGGFGDQFADENPF